MTFTQFVKRHSAFFGIERFVAVFTRAHHCIICWPRWIQSTHPVLLYHPKACFPVTPWSLMLRILKGFWRKGFFVCVFRTYHMQLHAPTYHMQTACSNIPNANCMFHPCHTRFDEPDNILWSSMRGKLCLSPSERNTGKEDKRDRRWPEGEKVTGELKKNHFVSSFMICAVWDTYTNEPSGLLFIVNLDWLVVWRSACHKVLCSTRVYLVCTDNFRPTACR